MLFTFIAMLLAVYCFVNFKKALRLYLACQLFLFADGEITSIPGLPSVTIGLFLNLVICLCYFHKYGRKRNSDELPFPYAVPFALICISLLLTCFSSLAGFSSEFTRAFSIILSDLVIVWICWRVLEKSDMLIIYEYVTYIMFFACIYGLLEYLISNNIILTYKQTTGRIATYGLLGKQGARGYRLVSLFEHPIGAGMMFGLYFSISMWLLINSKINKRKTLIILTCIMCLPCVILTKQRSAILYAVLNLFILINFKRKKFYSYLLVLAFIALVLYPVIESNLNIINSIFNSQSSQDGIYGSSIEMRLSQLEAVLSNIQASPITGLGEKYYSFVSDFVLSNIKGLESIWLGQLFTHGYLGLIVYIIYAVFSIIIIPRKFKSVPMFILSVSYWATMTVTSIPSFRTALFFIVLFYFAKDSQLCCGMHKKTMGKSISIIRHKVRIKCF